MPLCQPVSVNAHAGASERNVSGAESRRRNLWPLPGGVEGYPLAVQRMLTIAKDRPTTPEFRERVYDLFPEVTSESTVRGYVGVLVALGFTERGGDGRVALTELGRRFERSSDLKRPIAQRLWTGSSECGSCSKPSLHVRWRSLRYRLCCGPAVFIGTIRWHCDIGSGGFGRLALSKLTDGCGPTGYA